MANTVENLKTLKQLGFGNYKVSEGAAYGNSKAIWKLMNHYDKAFTDLQMQMRKLSCSNCWNLS